MSTMPSASAAVRPALAPATPSAMVATNPVSQLLKSLNVDPVASTAVLERLQRRMDERAAGEHGIEQCAPHACGRVMCCDLSTQG